MLKSAWVLKFPDQAPDRSMTVLPIGHIAKIVDGESKWDAHTLIGIQTRPWDEQIETRIADVMDDPGRIVGKYPVVVTTAGLFKVIEYKVQLVTLTPLPSNP